MSGERVVHGPNCWPWACVCPLRMTFEETVAANAGKPLPDDNEDDPW